ncbi:hypothetical protein ASD23_14175 [Agromyces sp. Root1464]|uniref:hypothetical protein n=1 Tax=Agromyces sp. Root1464 TaxID=1736467 RepID=UPI0006FE0CCB|nr:hypothetical protein [Agromyces sp. Root1464]KQZ09394.1 hypothetical protein ASD23_14175 [Agromyces sp. Root1464]
MHALAAALRSWPMLAALGAGLVLLALAAGAGGAMLPALASAGVAALGWGGLALRAGRVIAPSTTLVVTAVALVGMAAAVSTGAAAMTDVAPGPLAAASAFIVVVALSAGLELRARARLARAGAHPGGTRDAAASDTARLLGLVAGAALVAALATPALAATEAGESAVPHGTHELDGDAPAPVAPGDHEH